MKVKKPLEHDKLAMQANSGASVSQKKIVRQPVIQAIGGETTKNIKTFAILTTTIPKAQSESTSYNKKNKSLFTQIKEDGYVTVPLRGHFAGSDDDSFFIVNISFDTARKYAGAYNQTSFCFCNSRVIEYWEVKNAEQSYDSLKNEYVKKEELKDFETLSRNAENYNLIGKKFKFGISFSFFAAFSRKIQENIDLYFNGDNSVVDWCLNHVGYPVHLRMKRLYCFYKK